MTQHIQGLKPKIAKGRTDGDALRPGAQHEQDLTGYYETLRSYSV